MSAREPVTWPEAAREAVGRIDSQHHFHGDTCLCGFRSPVSRQRTEHLTWMTQDALATFVAEMVAQAKAEALREAADEMQRVWVQERTTLGMATDDWLRERAALGGEDR